MVELSLNERLRTLPSVDELLTRGSLQATLTGLSHAIAVKACRDAVAVARAAILSGASVSVSDDDVRSAVERLRQPNLRRVINATGVVLHTNLGRAPLAQRAIDRIGEIARGYCNLEMDLDEGERGSRYAPVVEMLCALTGAEDALVVNNGAASVLLVLSALAAGREAVVSRGELVEIGGGFRIPDVMRQAGVHLVEVGATNRTHLADYADAVNQKTGLLVKVHQSNFAQVGFADGVPTKVLATLAHERGVLLFEDLGSGVLKAFHGEGIPQEPTVASVVAAGADVVAFSGDKLLGGPQAGLIVGSTRALERLRKHPLNRALRVDKLTVAALEATLELYRDGVEDSELPVRALLSQPLETLRTRAQTLSRLLGPFKHRVVSSTSQVGGGSMPLSALPSWSVALEVRRPAEFHDLLRAGVPPIVARLNDGEVWLDVRCVEEADLEAVARAIATAALRN